MSSEDKKEELRFMHITSGLASASQLVDFTGFPPLSSKIDQTSLDSQKSFKYISVEEFIRNKIKKEIKVAARESKKENRLAFELLANL